MPDDFETALIHLEHDLDRLGDLPAPSHFADRLRDDADRLNQLARELSAHQEPA